uniref:Metallothionein n=1 Tax=Rhabditophanes sp. KR3021 TaxID=114890 RepID=A0AC35TJK3_9BILA
MDCCKKNQCCILNACEITSKNQCCGNCGDNCKCLSDCKNQANTSCCCKCKCGEGCKCTDCKFHENDVQSCFL